MNARSIHDYVRFFGLPSPTANIKELLAWIAARRRLTHRINSRRLAEVGVPQSSTPCGEPDFDAAAVHFLRAFNDGSLGRITLLPDIDESRAEPWFVLTPSNSRSSHMNSNYK